MTEYKNQTEQELVKILAEKRTAIQSFNLALSGGKMKNVREARNLRREVAQILTILKAKQVESAHKAAIAK